MTTPSEYIPTDQEPTAPAASTPGGGWFKASRSQDAWELQIAAPNAFRLAWVIAFRARYSNGFNRFGISPGEAMLGDHDSYAMGEQAYRTAKRFLAKHKFATFKATTKGTVGKLIDTRLFEVLPLKPNGQNDRQLTDAQRTPNGRLTTTDRTERTKERDMKGGAPPVAQADPEGGIGRKLSNAERISAEKQLEQEQERLHRYRENLPQVATGTICTDADRQVIRGLKQEIKRLESMLKI